MTASGLSSQFITARCLLRPVQAEDKSGILRLNTNSQARKYLGGPMTAQDAEQRWLSEQQTIAESQSSLLSRRWAVIQQQEQVFMGLIFLAPHHNQIDIEMSYLFLPEYWGQGYAFETLGVIRNAALSSLPRLLAETQSANTASCKLLEKLGFQVLKRLFRFGAEQTLYVCVNRVKAEI